jgi:hypothetical protein
MDSADPGVAPRAKQLSRIKKSICLLFLSLAAYLATQWWEGMNAPPWLMLMDALIVAVVGFCVLGLPSRVLAITMVGLLVAGAAITTYTVASSPKQEQASAPPLQVVPPASVIAEPPKSPALNEGTHKAAPTPPRPETAAAKDEPLKAGLFLQWTMVSDFPRERSYGEFRMYQLQNAERAPFTISEFPSPAGLAGWLPRAARSPINRAYKFTLRNVGAVPLHSIELMFDAIFKEVVQSPERPNEMRAGDTSAVRGHPIRIESLVEPNTSIEFWSINLSPMWAQIEARSVATANRIGDPVRRDVAVDQPQHPMGTIVFFPNRETAP